MLWYIMIYYVYYHVVIRHSYIEYRFIDSPCRSTMNIPLFNIAMEQISHLVRCFFLIIFNQENMWFDVRRSLCIHLPIPLDQLLDQLATSRADILRHRYFLLTVSPWSYPMILEDPVAALAVLEESSRVASSARTLWDVASEAERNNPG